MQVTCAFPRYYFSWLHTTFATFVQFCEVGRSEDQACIALLDHPSKRPGYRVMGGFLREGTVFYRDPYGELD